MKINSRQVDKANFEFYLVIKGRWLGIYNHWSQVLQQIENFSNPIFKGFHTFHEAISEARHSIGPNYFVSQNIKSIDRLSSSSAST